MAIALEVEAVPPMARSKPRNRENLRDVSKRYTQLIFSDPLYKNEEALVKNGIKKNPSIRRTANGRRLSRIYIG